MDTISQIGTFDVENYGDLLYPIIFRHILRDRQNAPEVRLYSLMGGDAPQQAGFRTEPVQSLFAPSQIQESAIVVGGGDLLRTDCDIIAAHYGKMYRNHSTRLRSPGAVADFLMYHARERLSLARSNNFYADRFRRRRMSYSTRGPFIIDPVKAPAGSSVSYLSCGVPHDFSIDERDQVSNLIEGARFIYLRDEQSAEKLRRTGIRRELHVAPDLSVLLSEQFDRPTEAEKGRRILAKLGIDAERPFVCFQSKPYPGFSEDEIVTNLQQYRQRTGSEIVLLPLGYCHDDHKFLHQLAKRSGGVLKFANLYSIFDIISTIAASDLFVGTSLHGNITAFSFGIPHVFGPLPVDKAEGFLRVAGLPSELKLRSWAELNEKMDLATNVGCKVFPEVTRKAQARVHGVVDALLRELLK